MLSYSEISKEEIDNITRVTISAIVNGTVSKDNFALLVETNRGGIIGGTMVTSNVTPIQMQTNGNQVTLIFEFNTLQSGTMHDKPIPYSSYIIMYNGN